MKARASSLQKIDFYTENILRLAAASAGLIVALIMGFMWLEASDFPHFINFFTDELWNPTNGSFNIVPILSATLLTTLGATILAIPFGLFSGIFLRLFAKGIVASLYRRSLEILAGIPSVVYGFWGLTTLVPLINKWAPPGAGLFTAILILAIMIIPTSALLMDAAFKAISDDELRKIEGMGLGQWGAFRLVLLPKSFSSLLTATLLSAGRAIGETMAVLMVAGNIVQIPKGLFDPIRTMTANIALELGYADADHRAALFACGFILLCLILILVFTSALCERKFRVQV